MKHIEKYVMLHVIVCKDINIFFFMSFFKWLIFLYIILIKLIKIFKITYIEITKE